MHSLKYTQYLPETGEDGQQKDVAVDAKKLVTDLTKNESGVVCTSDMDHSMYANDLGIQVFLEMIRDPRYWNFAEKRFRALLMPIAYRKMITKWASNKNAAFQSEKCNLAIKLVDDICKLFSVQMKLRMQRGSRNKREELNDVTAEFARKMIELDRVYIDLEPLFIRETGGELLMRTRFFVGSHPQIIAELTKRAVGNERDFMTAHVALPISKKNQQKYGLKVSENEIDDVFGKKSPNAVISRELVVVAEVRDLLKHLVDLDVPVGVASANLFGIVRTVVDESEDYGFLKDQDFNKGDSKKVVIATKLQMREDKLGPRTNGNPLSGPIKRDAAVKFARGFDEGHLKIAIGDSPRTDGDMIIAALARRGIGVLVGKTVEEVRAKFGPKFAEFFSEVPEAKERLVIVTTGREGFAN